MEEARAHLLENRHIKPYPAVGRTLRAARPCEPMKTRDRGLPPRKKNCDQIKGPAALHCIPLQSGARREDVQLAASGRI